MTSPVPTLVRLLRLPFPLTELVVLGLVAALAATAGYAGAPAGLVLSAAAVAAGVVYASRLRAWFWLRVTYLRLDRRSSFSYRSASVVFDERGIPAIRADSRLDALGALGYVMARERFFQMDLLRRQGAGRLAETLGGHCLPQDLVRRRLDLAGVAARALDSLPTEQRQILERFAEGVNDAYERCGAPFESRMLRQRPAPWTARDSLLIALELHFQLSFAYESERMLTVMHRTLPEEVVGFLTPRGAGGGEPIPVEALCRVAAGDAAIDTAATPPQGSNVWAVSGAHTTSGDALLANDVHLPLSVPNLMFAATVSYRDCQLTGFSIPGLPVFFAATTGKLAWGVANLYADCLDLVQIETHADDPDRYRTPDGWRPFTRARETVHCRGEDSIAFDRLSTIWGPVVESSLAGKPVAVQWTGLDADAINLDLIGLDRAASVGEGLQIAAGLGGPPLAIVVADDRGDIGWIGSGPLPVRRGIDGETAEPWCDGDRGWSGYRSPADLPGAVNPDSGVIVAANQRLPSADSQDSIGHNFGNNWRARRIGARITAQLPATTHSMLALQLDDDAGFYEFYRNIALSVLDADESNAALRAQIADWDGRANGRDSVLTTLTVFREMLLDRIFARFLQPCLALDEHFRYVWQDPEASLRALIDAAPRRLLPHLDDTAGSWSGYLLQILLEAADTSATACAQRPAQAVRVAHPLSVLYPWLGDLLDMPVVEVPGCAFSVRVSTPTFGAIARLVASPGRQPILQMPCGQSGHPLSPFYRSEHAAWAASD